MHTDSLIHAWAFVITQASARYIYSRTDLTGVHANLNPGVLVVIAQGLAAQIGAERLGP